MEPLERTRRPFGEAQTAVSSSWALAPEQTLAEGLTRVVAVPTCEFQGADPSGRGPSVPCSQCPAVHCV
eukprot:15463045-Alexandrium_andersonii.AAC.1